MLLLRVTGKMAKNKNPATNKQVVLSQPEGDGRCLVSQVGAGAQKECAVSWVGGNQLHRTIVHAESILHVLIGAIPRFECGFSVDRHGPTVYTKTFPNYGNWEK